MLINCLKPYGASYVSHFIVGLHLFSSNQKKIWKANTFYYQKRHWGLVIVNYHSGNNNYGEHQHQSLRWRLFNFCYIETQTKTTPVFDYVPPSFPLPTAHVLIDFRQAISATSDPRDVTTTEPGTTEPTCTSISQWCPLGTRRTTQSF